MSDDAKWTTIESDPGVFTSLITDFGVKGVQFQEMWSMGIEDFQNIKPIYGLIFLFKYTPDTYHNTESPYQQLNYDNNDLIDPDVFFAKQVINNACATQAILSVLLNSQELRNSDENDDVALGKTLSDFLEFSKDFPPDLKGLSIGNSEQIRQTHNSFTPQSPWIFEESKATGAKDEEVYHFIAYTHINGKVYELDGLRPGPILLGECPEDTNPNDSWINIVQPAIMERIERFSGSEIRFNLMALIKNRKLVLQERIDLLSKREEVISKALEEDIYSEENLEGDDQWKLASNEDDLVMQQVNNAEELEHYRDMIREQDDLYSKWNEENIRRKHNYIPFTVNLLQALADSGKLRGIFDEAKERISKKRDEREKAKKENNDNK